MMTLSTKTVVSELKDGTVETYEIAPEDFGFKTVDLAELQGVERLQKMQRLPVRSSPGKSGEQNVRSDCSTQVRHFISAERPESICRVESFLQKKRLIQEKRQKCWEIWSIIRNDI